ncbi:MAG: hypothetical protein A2288_01050 [Candidatus Moranbacteria bacterium RIFOXYA12_FULL_44_15]|nr:MAG: hypothetical protein A2288_01050 [Candidatus Moranbacteria bacterium RIFOXYA12_FULL_44_15]OGI34337.1 MAG: hypothetical protein A2259_02625 [Candidatus Moranbacteria bacterium RIFOXYA2_FULL_43_15]
MEKPVSEEAVVWSYQQYPYKDGNEDEKADGKTGYDTGVFPHDSGDGGHADQCPEVENQHATAGHKISDFLDSVLNTWNNGSACSHFFFPFRSSLIEKMLRDQANKEAAATTNKKSTIKLFLAYFKHLNVKVQ